MLHLISFRNNFSFTDRYFLTSQFLWVCSVELSPNQIWPALLHGSKQFFHHFQLICHKLFIKLTIWVNNSNQRMYVLWVKHRELRTKKGWTWRIKKDEKEHPLLPQPFFQWMRNRFDSFYIAILRKLFDVYIWKRVSLGGNCWWWDYWKNKFLSIFHFMMDFLE